MSVLERSELASLQPLKFILNWAGSAISVTSFMLMLRAFSLCSPAFHFSSSGWR
jgi:hypothetical protein